MLLPLLAGRLSGRLGRYQVYESRDICARSLPKRKQQAGAVSQVAVYATLLPLQLAGQLDGAVEKYMTFVGQQAAVQEAVQQARGLALVGRFCACTFFVYLLI